MQNAAISTQTPLSTHPKRNQTYLAFLNTPPAAHTIRSIAQMGTKLMRQAKLHHHFFGDHSLWANALYLIFFSMGLPYAYSKTRYQDVQTLDTKISLAQATAIITIFEQRIIHRIPVEYISQEASYLGHTFYVNAHVLVPRSVMNTRFRDFLGQVPWENYRVLDLCTGSGCIGISLALLYPNISVDLADLSLQALAVAQKNIETHALAERVHCIHSDLFENIQDKYDLIISNPPYVSAKEYQAGPDEFKNEPAMALQGGKDGLDLVHKILRQAKPYLNKQGILISEVGYTAAKRLKKQYPKLRFKWFNYRKSLEKDSFLDTVVGWLGSLDSTFLCAARDLPLPP